MSTEKLSVKERDFYRNLRAKVKKLEQDNPKYNFLEYVLLAPDLFHLLIKLTFDKDVPTKHKAKLGIAIAYFASPIDLIPDFIPVIGYLDDISVAAYALNSIINDIDPEIVRRNWINEETDILDTVQKIIAKVDEMIGKGLYKKIGKLFE